MSISRSPSDQRSDRATASFAVATRLSGTGISFLSAVLAVALLSPSRIGVFLSFAGLTAFSSLSDLGLNQSALLAAASRPSDDPSPIREAAIVVLVPTVVLTGALQLVVGGAFLSGAAEASLAPWVVFCLLAAIYQVLYLFVVIVEGTERRLAAWRANFILELFGGLALLASIALGRELWGFATGMLVRSILIPALFWSELAGHRRSQRAQRRANSGAIWREQLLPMQWKTAINSLAGLVTTRLLTPILLATNGAVTAGRVGLGLSLTAAIIGVTAAWPQSEVALYTQRFHEGRHADLFRRFRHTFTMSLALCIALATAAGVAVAALRGVSAHLADRLPTLGVLVPLLVAAPLAHISVSLAMVIRAQRDDPVVLANLVFSMSVLIALWSAATRGSSVFALAYLVAALFGAALYGWFYLRWCPTLPEGTSTMTIRS